MAWGEAEDLRAWRIFVSVGLASAFVGLCARSGALWMAMVIVSLGFLVGAKGLLSAKGISPPRIGHEGGMRLTYALIDTVSALFCAEAILHSLGAWRWEPYRRRGGRMPAHGSPSMRAGSSSSSRGGRREGDGWRARRGCSWPPCTSPSPCSSWQSDMFPCPPSGGSGESSYPPFC